MKFLNSSDWASKGSNGDIDNGDIVIILDEGRTVMGRSSIDEKTGEEIPAKEQFVFSIQTKNGAKSVSFNKGSISALVTAFGNDSDLWIGKDVQVHYSAIANRVYFAPVGWVPSTIKTKNGNSMTVFNPPSDSAKDAGEVFNSKGNAKK